MTSKDDMKYKLGLMLALKALNLHKENYARLDTNVWEIIKSYKFSDDGEEVSAEKLKECETILRAVIAEVLSYVETLNDSDKVTRENLYDLFSSEISGMKEREAILNEL